MRIAVVGSYGVGLTMRTARFPEPGETLTGGVFRAGHGGKGSNQAVAARRLGAEISLLTAVGDDASASTARDLWADEGIDVSGILTVPDAATMTGVIIVDEGAENRIVIAPGALDHFSAEDVRARAGLIESADALIVCLEIPMETACEALRIGREAGVLTVLNPAPARPVPSDIFSCIDVITPNLTEAKALLEEHGSHGLGAESGSGADETSSAGADEEAERLALALHEITGSQVVLTLGGDGSVVADSRGARLVAPQPPVDLVDTTGAGDSFTAALTVSLIEGDDLETSARRAAAVGAHVVAHNEVVPALPHRTELSAQLWPPLGGSADSATQP